MGDIESLKLIHPELSYRIVGILCDVYNTLGFGYQEKYYYKAIKEELRNNGLLFKEQAHIPLQYKDANIGRYFVDFIVDNKIVLEIKKGDRFSKTNIEQTYAYLKATGLQLGILVNFTSDGIEFRKVLNLDSYIRKNS